MNLFSSYTVYQLVLLYMVLTSWQFLKVGAQTETELKEKKLRVEDALNATKVLFNMLCHVCITQIPC